MDNISKYLEDLTFINWVFNPTHDLDLFWTQYKIDHPEEIANLQSARKIVLQFRSVAVSLSEADKIILFSKILKKIEAKQKSGKNTRILIGFARYAAIALIFFSIGAILFYRPVHVNPAFQTFMAEPQISDNQAQLIRSNGENVILGDNKSVISYQKSGQLVVNNDTLKPASASSTSSQSLNQLIIPYGKTSEIILPDGTKAFLNSGSRLAYPDRFTGSSREVLLIGEALFDVKPDPEHPFVVQVSDLRIKDLGTIFNVSAYPADGRVETVLVEGKVSISENSAGLFTRGTELKPGQLFSYELQTNQSLIKSVNVDDYILWTKGMMKFEAEDLNRITKKLERFYHIRFHFDDPMLGELKISGKMELKEDRTEVLERIARAASINIVYKGEDFYEIKK